jgi:hypothetical protein
VPRRPALKLKRGEVRAVTLPVMIVINLIIVVVLGLIARFVRQPA